MAELEKLSVVALIENVLAKGLQRGHVGTIVEDLAPGVYEVEFSDDQGRTYASAALQTDQLMRLYHEPAWHAAVGNPPSFTPGSSIPHAKPAYRG